MKIISRCLAFYTAMLLCILPCFAEEPATSSPQAGTEAFQTVSAPAPTEPAKTELVWISAKGTKFHRSEKCSNMQNPQQVARSMAEQMGRSPCKKKSCYG